jgi:CHAT domain-containing protein
MIGRWERDRRVPARPLWALGDPAYRQVEEARFKLAANDRQGEAYRGGKLGGFPRLPGTAAEVERLRGLMGAEAREVVLGADAMEATVKRLSDAGELAKYRLVHFACHGVLDAGPGLQPALVLAEAGGSGADDGLLMLDEVTRLRLNADLVVLSACRTGDGRQYAAEGVSGLARAFLYAGSRGVVCSLWQVGDAPTADLMAEFYAGLKAGTPAAEALRAAQLKMIESGEPPLHWAPFVLIGR